MKLFKEPRGNYFFLFSGLILVILSIICKLDVTGFLNSVFAADLDKKFWNFGFHYVSNIFIITAICFVLKGFGAKSNFVYFLFTGGLIIYFFFTLFRFSVNIPITDDYLTILNFSNQYFFTESNSDKWSLLLAFHGEYRPIFTRLIICILYYLTEEINIKILILAANACLPVMLYLFRKSIRLNESRNALTVIAVLLLFHFGYYDAIVWADVALTKQFTILFIMLTLISIPSPKLLVQSAAFIYALLAVITFGSGLLIFPLVIFYFIQKRNWHYATVWFCFAALTSLIYFINFQNLKQQTVSFSLIEMFSFSCCFAGSAFQFFYKLYLPFMVGLLLWSVLIYLTVKKYYRQNFFVYALLLFVMLSSCIAAWFRLGLGMDEAISNRYGIFSVIAVVAALISLCEIFKFQQKQINYIMIAAFMFNVMSSIFFFPEVPVRKEKLVSFIKNIKEGKPFKADPPVIGEGADLIIKKSMELKIYKPLY